MRRRILVVGATGTIGGAIVKALAAQNEVIQASRSRSPVQVDISDPRSIRAMYAIIGRVDAVVSAAGDTKRRPFLELTDDDYDLSIRNKLMGQVNLVRYGLDNLMDTGSFTLTGGVLGREPIPGGEAISMVNLALEGFARAAAIDLPRGIRVNVVSPPWVTETVEALNLKGLASLSAERVAQAYVRSVTEEQSGQVIEP